MARLFLNLSDDLISRIKYLALREHREPSAVIEKILWEYFDENLHDELFEMEQAREELKAPK